jgi:hypothetical protein
MHPDFDQCLRDIKGALEFVNERLNETPNPPVLMLANAVQSLAWAVEALGEYSTIPREVPGG